MKIEIIQESDMRYTKKSPSLQLRGLLISFEETTRR